MTKTFLLSEKSNAIFTITFNRPEVRNAMDAQFIDEFTQLLQEVNIDDTVRVVILRANGQSFCAGADLHWMKNSIQYTQAENLEDAKKLSTLMQTLYTLSKPTICLVQGAAYGGGVGLVACADIALATRQASFCFSEVKLGLIPAVILPYCLLALGHRLIRRYCLSAEMISADKAYEIGFIHEIVDETKILEKALEIANQISSNAPHAVKAMKALIQRTTNKVIGENLREKTMQAIARIRSGDEAQEGMGAFFAKRTPNWQKEEK